MYVWPLSTYKYLAQKQDIQHTMASASPLPWACSACNQIISRTVQLQSLVRKPMQLRSNIQFKLKGNLVGLGWNQLEYRYLVLAPLGSSVGQLRCVQLRWVAPLGSSVGQLRWVASLGSFVGQLRWVAPLGSSVGYSSVGQLRWVAPLGSAVGQLRWASPLERTVFTFKLGSSGTQLLTMYCIVTSTTWW